jgi:hypothetical protein
MARVIAEVWAVSHFAGAVLRHALNKDDPAGIISRFYVDVS